MFHVRGEFRKFFREEVSIFVTFFSSVFFSAELILSNLSAKYDPRGVRGHAPPENLHTATAILVLFEQLLRKVCHIFGP